jgi:2-(1,2-epoxy-1,2-dihydrophenyl)acetyl-CoA isomerase
MADTEAPDARTAAAPGRIRLEVQDDGVAVLTIDNPARRNAIGGPLQRAFCERVAEVHADTRIRALLVTGEGSAFCAGNDLSTSSGATAAEGSRGERAARTLRETANPMVSGLRALPVPVVCAVNGVAAGAGVGIALAGDVVLAAQDAFFLLPFIPALGLLPDCGATWFLPRLAGPGRALALALLGDRLPAETAQQWGLVWKCTASAALHDEALAIARRLAALPAGIALEARRAFDHAAISTLDQQLEYEVVHQLPLVDSPAFTEGVRAFLDKRKPVFAPRGQS